MIESFMLARLRKHHAQLSWNTNLTYWLKDEVVLLQGVQGIFTSEEMVLWKRGDSISSREKLQEKHKVSLLKSWNSMSNITLLIVSKNCNEVINFFQDAK